MNAPARLRTLEESLSPTEAVLRWLAEARAFGSFGEYAASTLEAPEGAAPLERIIARVEKAAHREGGRQSQTNLASSIASALEDALVRYELVLRLNSTTLELCERLRQGLHTLVAALGYRIADARHGGPESPSALETLVPVDRPSAVFFEQLDELVAIVAVENEARAMLERHYFDGAGVLFADVALDWQTLGSEVHHLSESEPPAKTVSGSGPGRRRRATRSAQWSPLARAAQERAVAIEADARLAALTTLGEQARATELLRTLAAAVGTDPGLAVRALERHSRTLAERTMQGRSEPATSAANRLDGLSPADQARQLRLLADELDGGSNP